MTTRENRDHLRRQHRPGPDDRCLQCGEPWKCSVASLLREVEQLEEVLRQLQDNRRALEGENSSLRSRMNQARDLLR